MEERIRPQEDGLADEVHLLLEGAKTVARLMGHDYVGTEHILLAYTIVPRVSVYEGRDILKELGIEPHHVQQVIRFIVGIGESDGTKAPELTPRAKEIFKLAFEEARAEQDRPVTVNERHIFIGIIKEEQGIAAGVLQSPPFDITLEQVRALPQTTS